jgi:hypothetical protein
MSTKKVLKEKSTSTIDEKVALEKLTRSLLRKIRENDTATRKENLKPSFRSILEKENF